MRCWLGRTMVAPGSGGSDPSRQSLTLIARRSRIGVCRIYMWRTECCLCQPSCLPPERDVGLGIRYSPKSESLGSSWPPVTNLSACR